MTDSRAAIWYNMHCSLTRPFEKNSLNSFGGHDILAHGTTKWTILRDKVLGNSGG